MGKERAEKELVDDAKIDGKENSLQVGWPAYTPEAEKLIREQVPVSDWPVDVPRVTNRGGT